MNQKFNDGEKLDVPEDECDDALKEALEGLVRVEGGSHLVAYQ